MTIKMELPGNNQPIYEPGGRGKASRYVCREPGFEGWTCPTTCKRRDTSPGSDCNHKILKELYELSGRSSS